jgi:TPP-dependent pyruvate/acetoin dehydrogenase alpha subunit
MSAEGETLQAFTETDLIRQVEVGISERYHPTDDPIDSPMKNPVHLSIGQEHIPVAIRMAAGEDAHAYATHRAHAAYLAWGGDLDGMIAELHGKATGCAGGWGGSMHLIDEKVGFMGTSAIVGSSLSYAVGDAFAAKLDGSTRPTVAFVGDAVPETGQFWEALNFSILHDLNLMIVIENNELATATIRSDRQPDQGRSDRQPGSAGLLEPFFYMKPWETPFYFARVQDTFSELEFQASEMFKNSSGVKVLWVDTVRMAEHVGPEYNLDSHDRLDELRSKAVELWDDITITKIEESNKRKVTRAFIRAERAPWPQIPWEPLGAPIR